MVENHPQADLAGVVHDRVHHLEAVAALEFGVLEEVDAIRGARGIEELVAVGQPDRVEAERLHLIHHLTVAASPEPVRGKVGRLETEPIDAGDPHRVALGVEDLATARLE